MHSIVCNAKQGLLREVVLASERVNELSMVRDSYLRYPVRWARNRVVPWAARVAFSEGVHLVNGIRLRIPRPPDWGGGGEFHMALGTYEKPELDFLTSRLQPGDFFVDIGAHIGYVALQAARTVGPSGRVIAVEPTAAAAEMLRSNVQLNGFEWVRVFDVAISDHDGSIAFVLNPDSPMWNRIGQADSGKTITVPSRSVDSLLKELGWPRINGLKIDVEGAEAEALRGSAETLVRNPQAFLIVEMEGGNRKEASHRTLEFFAHRGYSFRRFNRLGTPRPVTEQEIKRSLERDYRPLFNLLVERHA